VLVTLELRKEISPDVTLWCGLIEGADFAWKIKKTRPRLKPMNKPISLDDKYTATEGHAFMTGTQALVRLPMTQIRRDREAGLNTGAFISGYRGSPVGGLDQQLWVAGKFLGEYDITFQPGVNEELAATSIWGSQQLEVSDGANKDGVIGIWYGKGPGVDRCGDVFKHANAAGTSKHGGVLCIAGDDHTAKSSTIPHQSDHAFMAASMPFLYPSSIHEFLELGLFAIAMSRFSGCWTGMKVISDTIETTAAVDLTSENRAFTVPMGLISAGRMSACHRTRGYRTIRSLQLLPSRGPMALIKSR